MSAPAFLIVEERPDCGGRLITRHNSRDGSAFIGCGSYPRCKFTASYDEREQTFAIHEANLQTRIDRQRRTIEEMRRRIAGLESSAAAQPTDLLARELKLLARRFHPDLNRGEPWSTEVCGALLELRERVGGA